MTISKEESELLTREVQEEQESKVILNGVKKYLIAYQAELFVNLKESDWKDTEKREEIYRQLKTADEFEGRLLTAIQSGTMAREKLSTMDKFKQKFKQVI